MATSYVLVLASIAALVIYVQHIGQALRVSGLIELVGHDTRKLVDRIYPDAEPPQPLDADGPRVLPSPKSAVVTMIVPDAIVREAERVDCLIELVPALGAFVPAGAPLFIVHGWSGDVDESRLVDALSLKPEPTLDADVAYGMRLLVDIAERSLSESPFQDPTTAVQAIDRLHDILRQLAAWRRPALDDDERAMGESEGVQLAACRGVEIGAHSVHHLELGRVAPAVLYQEVFECRTAIERVIGGQVDLFAYPFGSVSPEATEMVQSAGYRYAVTCEARGLRRHERPHRLPRLQAPAIGGDTFASWFKEALGRESMSA